MSATATTDVVALAKTFALDRIAPLRVYTPADLDNMGKPRREYVLIFAVPGTVTAFGDDIDNGIRVTIEHNSHRKQFRASVKTIGVHTNGTREAFAMGRGPVTEYAPAAPVPGPRYSRKTLDQYADGVLRNLLAPNVCKPEDRTTAADVWDRIVAAVMA